MSEFLNQNKELIAAVVGGFIGVFGSICTLVASHFLRQTGKLTASLSSWNLSLTKNDYAGGLIKADTKSDAEQMEFMLGVDFYNSAETPKSLRKLQIEFKSKGRENTLLLPASTMHKTLEVINFSPYELVHLDLKGWSNKEGILTLTGKVIVSITALYPNGKKFKTYLITI